MLLNNTMPAQDSNVLTRTPTADEIRAQCHNILSDALFCNSKRYSDLFFYIIDRSLAGELECLKERIIGIDVFGRQADYNTASDATVRVAISAVRKRLAKYYTQPGKHLELHIEIPSGSYIPIFTFPENLTLGSKVEIRKETSEMPIAEAKRAFRIPRKARARMVIASALVLAAMLISACAYLLVNRHTSADSINQFWNPVLSSNQSMIIVLGRPTDTAISASVQGTDSNIPEKSETLYQFIVRQENFPVSELNPANSLTTFFEHRHHDVSLRLSSTIKLSQFRNAPAIILGNNTNEWFQQMASNMPFSFHRDAQTGQQWIEGRDSHGLHTWAVNMNQPYEQVDSEYSVISRIYNNAAGQWWIGIGGLTVLGTIEGQKLLTDPVELSRLIGHLPSGWESKNLQFVIKTAMHKGSMGTSTVVSAQVW